MKRLFGSLIFLLMLMSYESCAPETTELTLSWTIAGELPPGEGQREALGLAGPVAGLHRGILLIGGGANFPDRMPWQGGKKKYYDELYAMESNGEVKLLAVPLPFPLAYSACASTPYGIVCAGGENEAGISSKVLLIGWDTAAAAPVISDLPDLPVALTNAAITVKDHTVFLAGGETRGAASDRFFSLHLDNPSGGWKELPGLPRPVSHAVLAVQSNGMGECLYLAGGRKKTESGISDLYSSLYAFDLEKLRWTEKTPLPYTLCAGTGMAWGSSSILLFGGDRGETFHKAETLIAAIGKETDAARKEALNRQKIAVQATHPGFSKEVLQYDTETDTWSVLGNIPFDVPVTTTAVKWGDSVLLPSGEIRAGVRTPQILLGKRKEK